MRVLIIYVLTFSIYAKVNALKCYICDSALQGPSCYDPLDDNYIKAMDCKDVYKYQRHSYSSSSEGESFDFKQPEKLQSWNPNMNPNMNPNWNPNSYSQPIDFECVQYEQLYTRDNRRIYVRRCQAKNQSPNFCGQMENIGNYQGFKLTKCNVCYSDYCNKSGSIKLSLLLNFAFFLIFYQCTDF